MKPRFAALIAFLLLLPILAAEENPSAETGPPAKQKASERIVQSFSVDIAQSAFLQLLREDGPLNDGNWMLLPEWWLPLGAEARWSIDIARRISLSLSPSLSWRELGGAREGRDFDAVDSQSSDPEVDLDGMEARLSIREWGLEAVFGKMNLRFGSNYIAPLSAVSSGASGGSSEGAGNGLWMGGVFLAIKDLSLEAYCQTDPEAIKADGPVVIAAASALIGVHEAGFLFRRQDGNCLGAWYRGQVGDGLIPYAEVMLRDSGEFLDIAGLPARDIGWNMDALAGLGYSPREFNLSAYLEYRFRRSGYGADDWDALRDLYPPGQASAIRGFPFLRSAVHSVGLHLTNADEIMDAVSWSFTAVYLAPDGLYADATVKAVFLDRLSLGLDAACALLLGSDSGAARSEIPLWPYEWRFSAYLGWKLNAKE